MIQLQIIAKMKLLKPDCQLTEHSHNISFCLIGTFSFLKIVQVTQDPKLIYSLVTAVTVLLEARCYFPFNNQVHGCCL